MIPRASCLFLALALSASACIHAPDVVVVDRRTALEQQAAGRYPGLEAELETAAVSPGPEPLTRGELEAAGWRPPDDTEALSGLYRDLAADADRIDRLLVRRCIGEAQDGTLVETPQACTGEPDADTTSRLVERANRNRRQVWLYAQAKARGADLERVRKAWRVTHLEQVVCGGHVQQDDGTWGTKRCD